MTTPTTPHRDHERARYSRSRTLSTIACALLAVSATVAASSSPAYAGVDDYPAQWRSASQDSTFDSWREYNRECTSFVAWRLHSRSGFEMPFYDSATGWGTDARARGYAVNATPAAGSVAWAASGHVAWVEAVSGSTVTIEDYNSDYTGHYRERTVAATTYQYIHFKDLTNGGPSSTGRQGTGLTSVEDPATGRNIFYVGSDGTINQFTASGGQWVNFKLGGAVMQGTGLTSVEDPATGRNIFYVGSDGTINQFTASGGQWVNFKLGGAVMQGTGLTSVEDPATGRNIFYVGSDGTINQFTASGGQLVNFKLGGAVMP
jgi:surface antigen